jgi:hypothetical protein
VEQKKKQIYSENLATLNKILDEVIAKHLKSNNGQFSDAKIYEELRNRLTARITSMADSEDDLKIEDIRSELEKLTLSELKLINNADQRPRSEDDLEEEDEPISIDSMQIENGETQNLANLKSLIPMRRGASLKKDIVSTVIEEKKDEFNFVKDKGLNRKVFIYIN